MIAPPPPHDYPHFVVFRKRAVARIVLGALETACVILKRQTSQSSGSVLFFSS